MEVWPLILCIHLQMQSLCLALFTSSSATVSPETQNFPCRFHRSDVTHCAGQYHIARIPDEMQSYGFGFGSVDDTETMCKSKWHLHVQACIGERVLQRCHENGASEFQISMWQFIFDSRPHERAAIYLCKPHNMKIFRTQREECYKPHEASASICSQRQSKELARATTLLASQTEYVYRDDGRRGSGIARTLAADYVAHIQKQISAAHCETTLEKIRCLTVVLQQNCSQNAIKLIQNYFREMLPRHCYYTSDFKTDKWSSGSHSQAKGLGSASLRSSDQMHLLNDANHMETPLMIIKGSSNAARGNALFRLPLLIIAMAFSLQVL
ncbi:Peptidase S1 S6 chymotrypsin Hap active site [Echinococcus multilocularis]|uniref:Peptidase S1 S6 chymotrypsin Hap active site n=1 Tax=Echinococcus multilocularis TaxID=6211 RepID=A0A068Y925_ECHMU|nr:Peptidase S1 S6 chymotrypsin Hap active site [Echinococcus multilocularis]